MEDDLKGLLNTIDCNNHGLLANQQVCLNLTVKSYLYAHREEFIMREDCNAEMGLNMLLLLDIPAVNKLVATHKALKIVKSAISNAILPAFEVTMLTKKNWRDFCRSMVETYSRQCRVNAVLLLYVIREEDIGDYKARYASTEKHACTMQERTIIPIKRQCIHFLFNIGRTLKLS